MLIQLRKYLQQQKVANLQQLAREFNIEASALVPMLDFWVNKGVLRLEGNMTPCKSPCGGCKSSSHYVFV